MGEEKEDKKADQLIKEIAYYNIPGIGKNCSCNTQNCPLLPSILRLIANNYHFGSESLPSLFPRVI
jgi:hypothetical protein